MKANLFPLVVLALMPGTVCAQTERTQTDSNQQHVQWVGESLKAMQSVKVGMTRADLLKVFTTEGGLSTGLQRRYVYRQCPYFKVDIEFNAIGRPARGGDGRVTLVESGADTIKSISRPYLQFSIVD